MAHNMERFIRNAMVRRASCFLANDVILVIDLASFLLEDKYDMGVFITMSS